MISDKLICLPDRDLKPHIERQRLFGFIANANWMTAEADSLVLRITDNWQIQGGLLHGFVGYVLRLLAENSVQLTEYHEGCQCCNKPQFGEHAIVPGKAKSRFWSRGPGIIGTPEGGVKIVRRGDDSKTGAGVFAASRPRLFRGW